MLCRLQSRLHSRALATTRRCYGLAIASRKSSRNVQYCCKSTRDDEAKADGNVVDVASTLATVLPLPTPPDSPETQQSDLLRAGGVIATVALLAFLTEGNRPWIALHQDACMLAVFLLGYAGIILEESVALNKSGVSLVMAAALWSVRACAVPLEVEGEMRHALAEVSEVVFFLLGAMTVVEVIDRHEGFNMISRNITAKSKVALLWVIGGLSFCLSAMLDNLTTTIVMCSLLSRACPDPDTRRFLGAVVVIAANAGGAWTPIGDVTTTMLWVEGQMTPLPTMQTHVGCCYTHYYDLQRPMHGRPMVIQPAVVAAQHWLYSLCLPDKFMPLGPLYGVLQRNLLVPSLVSLLVPMTAMTLLSPEVQGNLARATVDAEDSGESADPQSMSADSPPRGKLVLSAGVGSLLFVPIFRSITDLPPYMGMLAGLGFLWLLTDALHLGEDRRHLKVSSALKEIDAEGVLFFLGILLAVGAMNAAGLLKEVAYWLDANIPSEQVVAGIIGLASALVDNVPLVAATQGMYSLTEHPPDSPLWQLIAYCAGTGGSLLIIGSSAGVAYMGLSEGASFGWYARYITPWAMLGYMAGLAAYVSMHAEVATQALLAV